MVMMTVVMELMSHQITVNQREGLALEIYLLVTMGIVYLEFTFAMVIMIVLTILMRTIGINAVSLINKKKECLNSLACDC